jgi:hypothetical protein
MIPVSANIKNGFDLSTANYTKFVMSVGQNSAHTSSLFALSAQGNVKASLLQIFVARVFTDHVGQNDHNANVKRETVES